MSIVSRRHTYDRTRILKEADQARAKKKWHRAIALYRRVLAAEPRNAELHARIAPLLARTGQAFDAWQAFDLAGRACVEAGELDRAAAVYGAATKSLPRHFPAWQALAEVETRQQRPSRAREVLLAGRTQMKGRGRSPEAIALLRSALDLEPEDVPTALDLCRLLARTRQQAEARFMLARLAESTDGRSLRRVRGLAWRLDPSLRNTWSWMRAAWRGRGDRRARVSSRTRLATR